MPRASTGSKRASLIAEVVEMPDGVVLEGAGDCLWDSSRGQFWMGCGFRSDRAAAAIVEQCFGAPCVPLELADPSFYHLDTAFSPLPCGSVIYYPAAFTPGARAVIEQRVAPADRIALDPADAARFAANAVCFGQVLVLSSCSETLREFVAAARLCGGQDALDRLPAKWRLGLLSDAAARRPLAGRGSSRPGARHRGTRGIAAAQGSAFGGCRAATAATGALMVTEVLF